MSRQIRRVAFFEPYPHLYGGGQRTTHLLAAELIGRGRSVTVVTPGAGLMTDRLSSDAIPWSAVALPATLRTYGHRTTRLAGLRATASLPVAWERLACTLRSLRPDVIHAVNLRGILLVGPVGRALRVPVVWHVHLSEPQAILNRLASRLAARVVVPSSSAVADLVGVRPDRVVVIPNAVTPEALMVDPDGRRASVAGARHSGPTLVTAARLTPQKGLDVLFGAIPLLLPEHPGLQVIVFGAPQDGYGGHRRELLQVIADKNLDTVVRFAGEVSAPFRHYADASVYVQPSRWEIAPLAILEAMAVGLPVVASDVGAVSELVEHGRTGLLVAPGDPVALAGAVHELLIDPDRAAGLGRAGATKARTGFSVEAMGERWRSLYDELP